MEVNSVVNKSQISNQTDSKTDNEVLLKCIEMVAHTAVQMYIVDSILLYLLRYEYRPDKYS